MPALHASPLVQALPSLQAPELGRKVQPVAGSQASDVQTLPSSQGLSAVCVQPLGFRHESCVQASPSSHPVTVPPVQEPDAQVSPTVHGSPSLQPALLLL